MLADAREDLHRYRQGYRLHRRIKSMKAVVVTRSGGPEVLEVRDMPDPQPEAGEVIVRVEAVGINIADTLSTRGTYSGTPPPPFISGREFAGVVESTGDRVMGYTQYGAAAEKIAMNPGLLWPQPQGWNSEQSAAFPVNFLTAYLAYWKAALTPDAFEPVLRHDQRRRRVLIHAAAGGVGEHTSELQSPCNLLCRLLLEKKKKTQKQLKAVGWANGLKIPELPRCAV